MSWANSFEAAVAVNGSQFGILSVLKYSEPILQGRLGQDTL